MNESSVELHVCIVNWRTADLTIDCLRSIAPERVATRLRVIVVDNDSRDGSFEKIVSAVDAQGWTDWVNVVPGPQNGGFAYGNNLAIRQVRAEAPDFRYVALLNPDTVVRPGAFRILLDFMQSHPRAGMAGGISEDPDTTRQHCSFRFPTITSEFASHTRLGLLDRALKKWTILAGMPETPERVDWVSGAHLIIRREVIDQIGLLDEGYFLYFEETDFLERAARAGWECWHVPASRVVHLVGQSSGISSKNVIPRLPPPYWFESRRRYFVLNRGRIYACGADLAVLMGLAIWGLRRRLQGLPKCDPPGLVAAILRYGAFRHGISSLKPRATDW